MTSPPPTFGKILVIEDDRVLADGLDRTLRAEGYQTIIARDGDDGLHQARTAHPDLIILDIMMPYLNGFELTTELRRLGDPTPIIVLSARTATKDKVKGLDLGVDDYLNKPFEIEELLARVRRRLGLEKNKSTTIGDKIFEWKTNLLLGPNGPLPLNTKETLLLSFFLKHRRQIVTRTQIIDAVWGDDYDGTDRTVDNFVAALRKKIGPDLIETVRGLGYRLGP